MLIAATSKADKTADTLGDRSEGERERVGEIKRRTSGRARYISLKSKRKSNKRAELESSSSRAIKDRRALTST